MSFLTSAHLLPRRFQLVLTSFMQNSGLAFADVLPEETIQAAFNDEGVAFAQEEDDVYTPPVTLWAFLSQVLFKDEQRSCVAAVSRVVVLLVALGRQPSDNTGAYCRARANLAEAVIRRLALETADNCERALPDSWLWRGRHVHLVDGTTVSMPDTEANQKAYPQQTAQQQGLGFPIARMVVLISLATAMVSGMALGPYAGKETGETALLRELFARLRPGDVLLADRCYCSYFLVAMLLALGVDFVVRLHHLRHADFRRGRRLGHGDHMVRWTRPAKPDWMDEATYDQLPESIEVREIEVRVDQPGFRTETLIVVTTLTDAEEYTKEDLAELYHRRWLAELDIRAIKVTLGMDVLRCKSPEMVRREIWTCLLAYNLIRRSMLQAAELSGCSPRALSFTAAMQKIAAGWVTMLLLDETSLALLIGRRPRPLGALLVRRPRRLRHQGRASRRQDERGWHTGRRAAARHARPHGDHLQGTQYPDRPPIHHAKRPALLGRGQRRQRTTDRRIAWLKRPGRKPDETSRLVRDAR